jgi:hypothetical protein
MLSDVPHRVVEPMNAHPKVLDAIQDPVADDLREFLLTLISVVSENDLEKKNTDHR